MEFKPITLPVPRFIQMEGEGIVDQWKKRYDQRVKELQHIFWEGVEEECDILNVTDEKIVCKKLAYVCDKRDEREVNGFNDKRIPLRLERDHSPKLECVASHYEFRTKFDEIYLDLVNIALDDSFWRGGDNLYFEGKGGSQNLDFINEDYAFLVGTLLYEINFIAKAIHNNDDP